MIIGPDVLFTPFLVALVGFLGFEWRARKRPLGDVLCLGLFMIYLFFVVRFAFLPLILESHFIDAMRTGALVIPGINLVPFRLGAEYGGLFGHQAVGNTLFGVPFGFGLMFVARIQPWKVLVAGAAFAVGIESWLSVVAFGTQHIERGPLARIHEVFLRRDGRTFEGRQLAVCQTASSGVSGSDPAGSTEIRMPS